jgi:hypothetical protein
MSIRTLLRHGGRAAVPLCLATAVVTMAAAPAFAATSLSISGAHLSNGEVHENDRLSVSGSGTATDPTGLSGTRMVKLSVHTASNGSYTFVSKSVASNRASDLSATFDTACAPWSGCAPAANGTYTFFFDDGNRSSSKSVTLVIPPSTPGGFTATTSGTIATFDWQRNPEPDLIGYAILDGGSDITQGGVGAGSVCDGSACELTMDFGSAAAGTQHTFSVVAMRHTAPGSSGSVSSAPSAAQSVTFAAAPAPSGSPGTTGTGTGGTSGTGGSGGGGTDGSTAGGGGGGHGRGGSAAPSGRHAAADLRATLPTISAGAAPNLPSVLTEVKPLPQGSFKPVLPYGDQVTREKVADQVSGVTADRVNSFTSVLDTAALSRAIAGAVVLFLVAAHLHMWVRRVEID